MITTSTTPTAAAATASAVLLWAAVVLSMLAAFVHGESGCHNHHTASCTVCEACCIDLDESSCQTCVSKQCMSHRCDPNYTPPTAQGGNSSWSAVPDTDASGCNVCVECCHSYLKNDTACESCVQDKCAKRNDGPFDCLSHDETCSLECIKTCTPKAESLGLGKVPCLSDCHSQHGAVLIGLVLLSILGRALIDYIFHLCFPNKDAGGKKGLCAQCLDSGTEISMQDCIGDGGWPECSVAGFQGSIVRLIFWHLLQPIIFFIVMNAYYALLTPGHQLLVTCVALREIIYLVTTMLCAIFSPKFLRVDLIATSNDELGPFFVAQYIFAPEIFIWMVLCAPIAARCGKFGGLLFFVGLILISALDICGTIGFISGLRNGNIPIALMIGYGATALATFLVLPCTTFGMIAGLICACMDDGLDSLESEVGDRLGGGGGGGGGLQTDLVA
jgi:hypothetical protein